MTELIYKEAPTSQRWVCKEINPENIINIVCNYYNIMPGNLQARCRKGEIIKARQMAMFMIKQKTFLTDAQISKLFPVACPDRSNVYSSINRVTDLMQAHVETRDDAEIISDIIGGGEIRIIKRKVKRKIHAIYSNHSPFKIAK